MRIWLAGGVVFFGVAIVGASAAALYSYGITADENGISGWNPAIWITLLAGLAVLLLGTVQIAQSVLGRVRDDRIHHRRTP